MRLLLTWSEWHAGRPQIPADARDPGPVRRFLAVSSVQYDALWLLSTRRDRAAARAFAAELGQ